MILQRNGNNISTWYTKQIQFSVRKRLLEALRKDIANKVFICRKDIYLNWDTYLKYVVQHGAVIEAEPIDLLGQVDSLCFIDPLGQLQLYGGVDIIVDQLYSSISTVRPQSVTPQIALDGATLSIAKVLFKKYKVIGYITIKFIAFWDALDHVPRLWGVGLYLGLTPAFCSAGMSAVALNCKCEIPKSLLPDVPAGRVVLHIPMMIHAPLREGRDDVFFKMCRMRGITFDMSTKMGTLFVLVDSIVGGCLSIVCIGSSRRAVLDSACYTGS